MAWINFGVCGNYGNIPNMSFYNSITINQIQKHLDLRIVASKPNCASEPMYQVIIQIECKIIFLMTPYSKY